MANGSNVICQRSTMNGARLKETEWKRWSKNERWPDRRRLIYLQFSSAYPSDFCHIWTTNKDNNQVNDDRAKAKMERVRTRTREREREWLNGSSNKKNEIVMCKEVRVDVAHSGNSSSVYFRLRHSTTDYSVLLGLFSIFLAHHFPFIHMKSRHINWQRTGIIHW